VSIGSQRARGTPDRRAGLDAGAAELDDDRRGAAATGGGVRPEPRLCELACDLLPDGDGVAAADGGQARRPHGRRPLVLGGLARFAAASAAAAAAPSAEVLIAFRVQQALAGALIVPNGVALLGEAVASGKLGSRLGLVGSRCRSGPRWATTWRAGARAGRVAGSLPAQPAAAGRAAGGGLVLDSGAAAGIGRRGLQSQRSGAALCVAGHAGVAAERPGSQPATSAGLVAVVAASAAALTWRELRHPGPVLDLRLFRRGPLSTASGAVALSNLAMYVTLLALSVLLSRGRAGAAPASGSQLRPPRFRSGLRALAARWAPVGPAGPAAPRRPRPGVMAVSLVLLARSRQRI
jgi:hypothetical protein